MISMKDLRSLRHPFPVPVPARGHLAVLRLGEQGLPGLAPGAVPWDGDALRAEAHPETHRTLVEAEDHWQTDGD